ncbi:hypothetical protein [Ulvibacterium marinum]|uniref:hypothetical protein n=1 Tax=Ulvibacterium marinum TaxID=2419782 RepID=UPI002494B3F3|nr:hypothetical protein [Ulvibacterium marinum]
MSHISDNDKNLLEAIKKRIAKASGLSEVSDWVQKDYEFVVFFIEDQTGHRLSLSTVKRIWKNEFERLPHTTTLDILANLAYNKDWHSIKKEHLSPEIQTIPKREMEKKPRKVKSPKLYFLILLAVLLLSVLGTYLLSTISTRSPSKVSEEVSFSYEKTVEGKIPNTVVFRYDIEGVGANRFFLQQSWDSSRKVEIFKGTNERTDIYYIPGYFIAKLFADEEIIKELPIHVTYEDWFMAARQPMEKIYTFSPNLWSKEDYLGIDKRKLAQKGVDLNKKLQLAFYYVIDFGLDGDNFEQTTHFKMEPLEAIDCPIFNLHVQGVDGYYWIMFGNKGCESELEMRLGDVIHNGKNEDLSMFGTSVYEWQKVDVLTKDKEVTLKLNGTPIFSSAYDQSIGPIMEISYFFNGIGMIDNVQLKNINGETIFADDFTKR